MVKLNAMQQLFTICRKLDNTFSYWIYRRIPDIKKTIVEYLMTIRVIGKCPIIDGIGNFVDYSIGKELPSDI